MSDEPALYGKKAGTSTNEGGSPPASSSNTENRSDKRLATTHPADPPPTDTSKLKLNDNNTLLRLAHQQ